MPAKKGPSCLLVGCLVIVGIFVLTAIISSLISNNAQSPTTTTRSYDQDGWNRKAVANERTASQIVGGFTGDEKRLYHVGLQHEYNQHENIGSFTIGQIVSGEAAREEAEKAAAFQAAQQRRTAEEAHLHRGTPDCLVLDDRTLSTESGEGVWYILGKVQNQCDHAMGYVQVEIGFYDSGGNLVSSGMDNVNNLAAGQAWSFRKPVYEDVPQGGTWKIEDITGF